MLEIIRTPTFHRKLAHNQVDNQVPHSKKFLCRRVHRKSNIVRLDRSRHQHHRIGDPGVQVNVIQAENELLRLYQNVRSARPEKVKSGCGSLYHERQRTD
jgi:hypothetical protein